MFKKLNSQIKTNEETKKAKAYSRLLIEDESDIVSLLEEIDDVIKGGKADTYTLETIAKKHGVKLSQIKSELEIGLKVEMEHTNDKGQAAEICKDHLVEFPDYYTRLLKMEKEAEKDLNETFRLYEEILSEEIMPKNPEYGLPEDKAYPLYDKLHVMMAIKMFIHADKTKHYKLARVIIRKMRFHGMRKSNVGKDNPLKPYVDASNLPE